MAALLHLAPNSPDAKVFEDFANSGKKSNATAPSAAGKEILLNKVTIIKYFSLCIIEYTLFLYNLFRFVKLNQIHRAGKQHRQQQQRRQKK